LVFQNHNSLHTDAVFVLFDPTASLLTETLFVNYFSSVCQCALSLNLHVVSKKRIKIRSKFFPHPQRQHQPDRLANQLKIEVSKISNSNIQGANLSLRSDRLNEFCKHGKEFPVTGVDVMITIFGDFRQFFGYKNGVFSKTHVMIKNFA
jgi:hypothetical protein